MVFAENAVDLMLTHDHDDNSLLSSSGSHSVAGDFHITCTTVAFFVRHHDSRKHSTIQYILYCAIFAFLA